MLANAISESTATTGTGPVTLGGAVSARFSTFDGAVLDGSYVDYVIEDGDDMEIGVGTFDQTANTITRPRIIETLVSGSKTTTGATPLNLSGSATISIMPTASTQRAPMPKIHRANQDGYGVCSRHMAMNDGGSHSPSANTLYLMPFETTERMTIDGLSFEVRSAASSGSTAKCVIALMRDDVLPGALLLEIDASAVIGSTGAKSVRAVTGVEIPAATWVYVGIVSDTNWGLSQIDADTVGLSPLGSRVNTVTNRSLAMVNLSGSGWDTGSVDPEYATASISDGYPYGYVMAMLEAA